MTTTNHTSPLLSQTRASEVHEANRVAVAAVVFALITYVFSLVLCCRRRCCNSKLGVAEWCGCPSRILWLRCDGRVVSRQWSRYACWLIALTALCGASMTIVFFVHYDWTAQHQLQSNVPGCNYTADAMVNPCSMSYQVFWSSLSSYIVLIGVVIISWNACVLLLPFWLCWTKAWRAYRADDDTDGGLDACLGKYDDVEKV